MSLTTTEEAQTRALLAQNAALLSLASSEPTIISKLGATKVSLADLTAATSLSSTDLFLVRQGTVEKSTALSVLTPDASLTAKGLVELATSAETVAGVDTVRAVTPAGLMSGFVNSLATNGYQKLPSGLIIQWGAISVSANASTLVTLPIAFPSVAANVSATFNQQDTASASGYISAFIVSNSQIRISNAVAAAKSAYWFAIGY